MNRRFAYLIAAGLILAAGPQAVTSASNSKADAGVDILVDDVPQHRYVHEGRLYIEARKGKEYAIRLRNPLGVRVAVALSVDGLNTIDARETTATQARKWVLGPYETVTIRGWQTSEHDARRFEFTSEERSYGRALGKTQNLGVISAAFFKERAPLVLPETLNRYRQPVAPSVDAPAANDSATAFPPAPAVEPEARADGALADKRATRSADEYAATGMGRRTDHPVTRVWLDLDDAPFQSFDIRYEFRPQLVRLGILPRTERSDPLRRRERAHGFEPGFCPTPDVR